jgi:hypothetical protein
MSQPTHPIVSLPDRRALHRVALAVVLVALATTAVVIALTVGGGSSDRSGVRSPTPLAVRADGGPDESAVAGAVTRATRSHPVLALRRADGGPDEGAVAVAVGAGR